MKLELRGGLPHVSAELEHGENRLTLDGLVIDTGSAGSVFPAELVRPLGVEPRPSSPLRRLLGVGGAEFVFSHPIDGLRVGDLSVRDFEIQVGAMDYGFALNGILGTDFLLAVGAVIDLERLELRSSVDSR